MTGGGKDPELQPRSLSAGEAHTTDSLSLTKGGCSIFLEKAQVATTRSPECEQGRIVVQRDI